MSKMGQELDKRLDEAKYDMYEALQTLLKEYYQNRGNDGEFISCITPKGIPYYWKKVKMIIEHIEGVSNGSK